MPKTIPAATKEVLNVEQLMNSARKKIGKSFWKPILVLVLNTSFKVVM